MKRASGEYHRLRPDQIDAIRSSIPIAYLPWGALEWHSYHNPVGLDGMIAEGLCLALARETGGLVLPPIYVATDTIKPFKGFRHSLEHAPSTVEQLCTEFFGQLVDEQFMVVVVVTGHCGGGHTEALGRAVAAAEASHAGTGFKLIAGFEPVKDTFPMNHAAYGETSLQLYFDDANVDLDRLPADRPVTLDIDGVWGDDPARATAAAAGREIAELFVARCIPEIEALLATHIPKKE